MTKRVLSLLLVLVMALSLSVPAFADGEDVLAAEEPATDVPAPIVDWIPIDNEADLKLAMSNKQSPIELGDNITVSDLTVDYALVLNLSTYQLKGDITVKKGASLTVNATLKNGKVGGIAGKVTVGASDSAAASLTVNSGYVTEIVVEKGAVSVPASSTANIYKISADANKVGTISIAGGTIGNAVTPDGGPVLSNASRNVDVTISGGEFYASDYTVNNQTERNYITGGIFVPSIGSNDAADAAAADVALNTTYAVVTDSDSDTYTVVGQAAVEAEAKDLTNGDKIEVQQGNAAFTDVPAGVTVANAGDGTVTVDGLEVDETGTMYLVRIGSKGYKSLTEAVAAASTGDTITLLDNIDMADEAAPVAVTKSVTLDLNKKVITTDGTMTLTFGNTAATTAALIPTITVTGAGNIMGTAEVTLDNVKLTLEDVNVQPTIKSGVAHAAAATSTSLTVGADSIVVNIGDGGTAFNPDGGTVTISGTVNGIVNISGEDSEVIINDGASVGDTTTLGDGKYMSVTIAGGEFSGTVTVNVEEHAPVAITGGVFKATTPIKLTSPTKGVISGGIYNTENLTPAYVKTGCGAAVITDSAKKPYKYSKYTFVGDTAVAEGLANVAKGSINVTTGTVTLAAIGNDITASTGAKAYLKVGNVTVGSATGVTGVSGAKINELNSLIATAQRAQVSGKLSDEALQDLVEAYIAATSAQDSKACVQDCIDGLKEALVGYEDEETPTAPASGTGWVETASGEWYYFLNGTMVKNQWVESGRALWYYMNPDGTLAHGGFTLVPTCRGINKDGKDAGTFAAGYFYLRHNNYNGCIGQARHGTVAIEASTVASVPAKGTGVFETKHNGHYGACVSINGKAVKNYTELPA